jgi:sulfopropanediol 3-dehydrogenase
VADYLKRSERPPAQASGDVRSTVAEILSDVERRGEAAVRDWSLRLDGWAPDSFVVERAQLDDAEAAVPDD